MYTTLLLRFLCAFIPASANNEFTNPASTGLEVLLGSQVDVKWRCDDCGTGRITLNIWQNKGDGNWAQETLLDNVVDPGGYTWTAHTIENLPIDDGFHFGFVNENQSFDSGALFIRNTLSSTSTSATPTPTPSTSPTSALAVSTSASAPTNPSPNNNDETLRVGLGAGLGVGIPFLLLIGGIIGYIIFRKTSYRRPSNTHEPGPEKRWWSAEAMGAPVQELRGDEWRHEMHPESRPSELHG